MNVLYDHQIFSSQVYGGISRYFYELMRCFSADSSVAFELALKYTNNSYLGGADFYRAETFFKDRRFIGKTTVINAINRSRSIRSMVKGSYDVVHPTYYDPYFLEHIGNRPYVVTVYDMIHELYPQMFPPGDRTREWKRASLQKAAVIIAISESTKNDMVRFYGLDESRISVIYLASSLETGTAGRPPEGLPERYMLFVGQRNSYKNFALFVSAVAPILKADPELAVVCAGGGALAPAELAMLSREGLDGRFLQYSVHDDLLVALYSKALFFVFPSLYEGFGIPVLEAFGCGCPVLVSKRSSFPEVAGDAALLFDPEDRLSLQSALQEMVSNAALRNELKIKGLERHKAFSWKKTSQETEVVYQSVL